MGFLDGHELGEIVNEPLDVLRVLADGSQFLGVEIGRQLFAQNDLTEHCPQIGRAGSIFYFFKTTKNKERAQYAQIKFKKKNTLDMYNTKTINIIHI